MEQFHPIIQQWFGERYGLPTDIQELAWPRIAAREHLLITAPTGSGKTLTAFLWTLNRFVTGELENGKTRILYVSPLKALNNDIQKNLLEPLAALREKFEQASIEFPSINVATRSGDTDAQERRRMLRKPPEILITTPESLNILLTSAGGRNILFDVDTVLLDEIHGVIDSKRGVYLMSAVERLTRLSGEFQRIALSATVNPLDTVAKFVAGYQRNAEHYEPRRIATLVSRATKSYDITVRYPEAAANRGEDEKIWDYLAEDLLPRIHTNQSTLIFVNSRALCEKLTFKLNNAAGRIVAWAHHGSLSREIRTEVESRLKDGKLEAIVATSSLEMGIDIGALDEVILVQSPGSIASSIQRIGRAGHQVGAASRCTIYPTHPQDFIEAAVLSAAVMEKSLEPVTTISNPLDVLAQIIVSMTGSENWDIDELFLEVRQPTAYRTLRRQEFDLVINMLLGRYADRHIRELKPRVRVDRIQNRIEARKGAVLSLYLSGGVIPDRGYFQLRHERDNARIGELDEEFVWEANVGQTFSLGTQTWQVKKITHNDVVVGPGKPGSSAPPFWKAEPLNRTFHYAQRIGEFLEAAEQKLETPEFRDELIEHHKTEPRVADEIILFLNRQRAHCHAPLPHRHHLLMERIRSGPGRSSMQQMVLHTGWGARVNRPFAMAMEAAWQSAYGEQPEIFVANESLVLQLPHQMSADEILNLVPIEDIESLLRQRLEGSGFFGARFRENAGRSLLLSKGRFNERKPLWMSRLQSQKLMDAVMKYEDFPILLETWRTCLQDEFDLDHLKELLGELHRQEIIMSEVDTATPSPFAQSVAWDQINTYMYMSDSPKANKSSNLREDLLKEVVFSTGQRPTLARSAIDDFLLGRQRLLAGYEPADNNDLEDWIKERSLIPAKEFAELLKVCDFTPDESRFSSITVHQLIVSRDDALRFDELLTNTNADQDQFETLIANWLQYYGPVNQQMIESTLGISPERLAVCLEHLVDANLLISGQLITDDAGYYYCDAENYEFLLRQKRAAARVNVEPRPVESLTPFIFSWQTNSKASDPLDRLFDVIDKLTGLPLPAALWESEVLPARVENYQPGQLDLLFQEGTLGWAGMGEKRVAFLLEGDLDLIHQDSDQDARKVSDLIPDERASYDFGALLDITGLNSEALSQRLWSDVWSTRLSNDSMMPLRKAISNNFSPPEAPRTTIRGRRAAFNRWRAASSLGQGNWYQIRQDTDDLELLEQAEQQKNRARLLLERYGIVFRELCLRESKAIVWSQVFRALRLMELSGEVVSGYFFQSILGPQYMTQSGLRHFQQDNSETIFFVNAADPVSPSGLGLGSHGEQLPRRIPSNHLVYHGDTLVMTSARRGRDLTFHTTPNAPSILAYFDILDHLNYRAIDPVKQLRIETINGVHAATSPFRTPLEARFNLYNDFNAIVIQREL